MPTWEEVHLSCPLCQTAFESKVVTHVQAVGQDTDGRFHFKDIDPLPTFIHTCPNCWFTASRSAFKVHLAADEIFRVRAFIERQGAPEGTSGRYMLVARVQEEFRRDEPIRPANAWLTAAWAARLEGARAIETDCQRRAVRWFDEDLRLRLTPPEDRTYLTYLVGDLYRRVSRFDLAVRYFDAVPGLASPESPEEKFLITMSVLQKHYATAGCQVNTMVPVDFIKRGYFLRHFRVRLDKGGTRQEVSVV